MKKSYIEKIGKTTYANRVGRGVQYPEALGGGFREANLGHDGQFYYLWKHLNEFYRNLKNGKKRFIAEWENYTSGTSERLKLSVKDVKAYEHWKSEWRDILPGLDPDPCNFAAEMAAFEYFAIKYLNCAKVGTGIIDRDERQYSNYGILTADFTPHVTFEPWIKEGFKIERVESRFDFNEEKCQFFDIYPSLSHIKRDEKKKTELELDLGIKL